MKKISLMLSLLLPLCAQADNLKTFSEVEKAISKGKKLAFVLNLAKCDMELPAPVTVTLRPDSVMLMGNNKITTSHRHFTINNPSYPNTAVYDYTKISINAENEVAVAFTTLNAEDYDPLGKTITTICQLNDGVVVYD